MNATVGGLVVSSIVTLALVGMVALGGGRYGRGGPPPAPDPADGEHVTCHDATVRPVGQAAVTGRAWLCLNRGGIQILADLERLLPDTTYTAWLGYFDRPGLCPTMPCAETLTAHERAAGLFERIDSLTPDLAGRASISRSLREVQPTPGAQLQVVLFQAGALGSMRPADRVRLLVEWPLDPTRGVDGSSERPNRAALVARATLKLYETPQSSQDDGRPVGAAGGGRGARGG